MARGHWSAAAAGASMTLMSLLAIVSLAAPWWAASPDSVSLWGPEACGPQETADGCSYFQAARACAVLTALAGLASASVFALAYASARKVMHLGMCLWAASFIFSLLALGMGSGLNGKLRGVGGPFSEGLSHSGVGWICMLLSSGVGIAVGILISFTELSWPKDKKPAGAGGDKPKAGAAPHSSAPAPAPSPAAPSAEPSAAAAPCAAASSAAAPPEAPVAAAVASERVPIAAAATAKAPSQAEPSTRAAAMQPPAVQTEQPQAVEPPFPEVVKEPRGAAPTKDKQVTRM